LGLSSTGAVPWHLVLLLLPAGLLLLVVQHLTGR
jgi:hypothetical protein